MSEYIKEKKAIHAHLVVKDISIKSSGDKYITYPSSVEHENMYFMST